LGVAPAKAPGQDDFSIPATAPRVLQALAAGEEIKLRRAEAERRRAKEEELAEQRRVALAEEVAERRAEEAERAQKARSERAWQDRLREDWDSGKGRGKGKNGKNGSVHVAFRRTDGTVIGSDGRSYYSDTLLTPRNDTPRRS